MKVSDILSLVFNNIAYDLSRRIILGCYHFNRLLLIIKFKGERYTVLCTYLKFTLFGRLSPSYVYSAAVHVETRQLQRYSL